MLSNLSTGKSIEPFFIEHGIETEQRPVSISSIIILISDKYSQH